MPMTAVLVNGTVGLHGATKTHGTATRYGKAKGTTTRYSMTIRDNNYSCIVNGTAKEC